MKKNVLIIGGLLAALGLSALGIVNWNQPLEASQKAQCQQDPNPRHLDSADNPFLSEIAIKKQDRELFYNVSSRFNWTVLKSDLLKARSATDLLPPSSTNGMGSCYETELALLPLPEGEKGIMGTQDQLNHDQLNLLESLDYSDNFFVQARYKKSNPQTGKVENDYIVYYTSVLPEKAARYSLGFEALINYLKEESKAEIRDIKEDQLKPGRYNFTISTSGEISGVEIDASCGYPSIDESLVELLKNLPGKWIPAMNEAGQAVEQNLVFFFGQEGC